MSAGPSRTYLLLLLFTLLLAPLSAKADEPLESSLMMGAAHTVRSPGSAGSSGSLEYRLAFGEHPLSVLACYEWNGGIRYLSIGVFLRLYKTDRFLIGIGSGPGIMKKGDVLLGSNLEFRSVAEFQWRLTERSFCGVDYCHYSNAGAGSVNPGAESVRVFVGVRF